MDSDEEALLLALLLRRRRRKQRRKLWMHPLTSERLTAGQFYTTMNELKMDNAKFFNYFRMSQDTFNQLLNLIKLHIQRADTNMRRSIPAEERLAITLRYLATGCSFTDLCRSFRCGMSTAHKIVIDVCEKIWQHQRNLCIPDLTEEEWFKIADGFESLANFPNCIGAIGEKNVRLIQPRSSGSIYFSPKKYFSMELLAVCDSNYSFTFVDIGSCDKTCDSSIYRNSLLFQKMKENTLNIPNDRPISVDGDPLPFTFIGEKAFGLSTHMLKPYGGKNLSQKKKNFNYRLSRARRCVECAFAILTNKWHIFHRPLYMSIQNAETIIKACFALHNFVRERDGVDFEDTLNVKGLDESEAVIQPKDQRSALTIREKFAEYFSSEEGSVPWQSTGE